MASFFSRRDALSTTACGFGMLALRGLMSQVQAAEASKSPLAEKKPHFAPKAKRVIFIFMHGGVSQVDTFDYKPELNKRDGQDSGYVKSQTKFSSAKGTLLASPWKFKQYGESGKYVSELFPHVAKHVDDLCFLNAMHTNGQSHGQAVLKLHTGVDSLARPSMGAWINYGLGTQNQNLPGFITVCPPANHGGVRNYSSSFLPAIYQGTALGKSGSPTTKASVNFIKNESRSAELQKKQLDFLQTLNHDHLKQLERDSQVEGVIESFELAYRMQSSIPDVTNISDETEATKDLYGMNEKDTSDFGLRCMLGRRFSEAGVRFVQISSNNVWDQHSNLKNGHEKNSKSVDKPVAGLLTDLKQRGLLDETLVVFASEFGRTPMVQGANGRDHNPFGFTVWMTGAGLKKGITFGSTDELGFLASEDRVHMHDLHATLLHLMGLNHEKLTYRYAGRDFRLTDISGHVVHDILS